MSKAANIETNPSDIVETRIYDLVLALGVRAFHYRRLRMPDLAEALDAAAGECLVQLAKFMQANSERDTQSKGPRV